MSKHTPGPWYADDAHRIREVASDLVTARADDGGHVTNVMINAETQEANARLIAAAPEMLEALKRVKADLDNAISGELSKRSREEQRADIRAAIAKAEGK